MDISRSQIHFHATQTSQALHKAGESRGLSQFAQTTLGDRSAAVDDFVDRLERTPGTNEAEIRAASQARGSERANIGRWVGVALGGTVVLATLACGGPFGAALVGGGSALLAGFFGGEKAKDIEQDFQKNLGNFSHEIGQGQAPDVTSGVRLEGRIPSGPMNNDEWLMTIASPLTSPLPGIRQTPF